MTASGSCDGEGEHKIKEQDEMKGGIKQILREVTFGLQL